MEEGTEEVIPEDIISYSVLLHTSSNLELILKNIKKLTKFRGCSVKEAMKLIEEDYIQNTNQIKENVCNGCCN